MNRIVSEKMSHQRRLIDKMQQYVRVHDNQTQRAAPSASVDNSSSNSDADVSEVDQDAFSAQLSVLVNSLKAISAGSVQVSYHHRISHICCAVEEDFAQTAKVRCEGAHPLS